MQTTRWIGASSFVIVICVTALLGAALYSLLAPEPQRPALDRFAGEKAALEGVVVRDPERREKTTHLTVELERVAGFPIYGKPRALVFADRFVDVSYGDRVVVEGKIQRPEPFDTDSGRTFNYPKYLLAHGITHTVSFPLISVVASGEGNSIVAGLISVKHAFLSGIERALPEPESALLEGLLLGEKQSLGDDITDAFRAAGVVHIIVLSGYNVALVIRAVLAVVQSLLPKAIAFLIAGGAILAFALMTGASETTIRASVMAGIVLIAQLLNRPTVGVRILLIAAAGMAVWNPYLVLYDLSYQLSILATLGLVLFSDPLTKRLSFITERLGLREITATTIATQVTVLPLLILSVGQVSVVSLFANVAVLPAVAPAMLFGFLTALVALVSSALATPLVFVSYALLRYIVDVSVALGSLPFASFVVPTAWAMPALVILGLWYAFVAYVFFKKKTPVSGGFGKSLMRPPSGLP